MHDDHDHDHDHDHRVEGQAEGQLVKVWPAACRSFASVALMLYGEKGRTPLDSGCPWEKARDSVKRDFGL